MSDPFDIVFRNCTLIDGAGGPRRTAIVAVGGECIAAVDPPAKAVEKAGRVVDATGLVCCPGFIDIHSHSDFACFLHPLAESKVMAGVTTEVDGNCGMSAFPLRGEVLQRRRAEYEPDGLELDWSDLDGYAARIEDVGSSINRSTLVGHGNVRGAVMGYGAGRPTGEQLKEMCREVETAMAAGAYGLSTGLIYPPGLFSDADEIAPLAAVVADHGGYYASHIRSEGDGLESGVDEFLETASRAGVRALLSHVKTAGTRNWHKIDWLGERLFRAKDEGLDLWCDRYPYIASHTSLDAMLLPKWAFEGGTQAELDRLTDPATRAKLREETLADRDADYWPRVMVTSVRNEERRHAEGKNLQQIGDEAGAEPVDAALDLIVAEGTHVAAVNFGMSEDNLQEILRWPFVMVGSDSSLKAPPGPGVTGKPHPRAFATPTRVLAHYVRNLELMSLEEAVAKLTSMPARVLGLRRRGTVAEGNAADLCLFRPDELAENSSFEDSRRLSGGMRWVLVNGQAVVRDGEHTGARPGRLLRGPDA